MTNFILKKFFSSFVSSSDMSLQRNLLKLFKIKKWPNHAVKISKLQSHRGIRKNGEKENTLESLNSAKKLGAEMCEFDVMLSKDGIPFLHHDYNLKRIFEVDLKFNDADSGMLDQLGVTRLETVFTSSEVPDVFNIEIKSEDFFNSGIESQIIELMKDCKVMDRVMISSFNPIRLFNVSRVDKSIPLALLVGRDMDQWYLEKMLAVPLLNIHMLNLDRKLIDYRWIEFLRENEIPYSVWTSNDLEEIRFLLKNGATSVISDIHVDPTLL